MTYALSHSKVVNTKEDIGGATRDRTADLLRARQALSQLSYSPIEELSFGYHITPDSRAFFVRQGILLRSWR